MPRNVEFLVYAYGITITVVTIFYLRTIIKLRSVSRKLDELNQREG